MTSRHIPPLSAPSLSRLTRKTRESEDTGGRFRRDEQPESSLSNDPANVPANVPRPSGTCSLRALSRAYSVPWTKERETVCHDCPRDSRGGQSAESRSDASKLAMPVRSRSPAPRCDGPHRAQTDVVSSDGAALLRMVSRIAQPPAKEISAWTA